MPNPGTRREHAGAAVQTTITAPINSAVLSFTLTSAAGWPTGSVGPFVVIMDPGTIAEEKINCDSRASTTITVNASGRGFDGTTAQSHSLNATVYPIFSAVEADELNAHHAATTAVHGVAGAMVGTTDSQVLTNKTISADNNTLSGIAATSFVLSNGSGNIDGAAAQKAIPSGAVVGTTDTQVLTGKTITFAGNTLTGVAPLDSPTFTTAASAPTPAANDNDTSIATTAYVQTELTAYASDAVTLTNKRVTPRVNTVASSATPAIATDTTDHFTITALATAVTSFTTSLTGTPADGQKLIIRIKDNGTARALAFGASFASRGATLPTTTVLSKVTYVGLIWNAAASTWDCVAATTET